MADVKSISLDQEAQEIWERNEDLIEDIYGGRSALFKDKLKEIDEQTDLETKISQERSQIARKLKEVMKHSKRLSRLEERKEKQEVRKTIDSKQSKLEDLKSKLRKKKNKSESQIRNQTYRRYAKKSNYDVENNSELRKTIEENIERRIARRDEKIEEYEKEIQDLKSEIRELRAEISE